MSFTFAPAVSFTERAGLFVSLTGGTNSGKTFSAMRLARGIAGPNGKIAVLDTEGGRTLHLKDAFAFDANVMEAPFRPERFSDAARAAEEAGYAALVIDSFSMEWVGLGGVLDWQSHELQRMAGDDYRKQERMKMASWIKPKTAHKAMVYALLQRRIPIIFSIRGEETVKPGEAGEKPTRILKSVCNSQFPYEVTVSFRLEAERKGYVDLSDPKSFKMEGAHGAALAAWARGERGASPAPAAATKPNEPRSGSAAERLFTAARQAAAKGQDSLSAFRATLDPRADAALAPILSELDRTASYADASDDFPGSASITDERAA